MKNILMIKELTSLVVLAVTWILGYQLDPNSSPITFCRGYNYAMRQVIREYEESQDWNVQVLVVNLIMLIVPFVELGIYLNIFQL